MRSAIVTGGTGALGSAVVARLLDDGYRVIAPWIVRAERDVLAARYAERLDGDLLLPEADVSEAADLARVAALCEDARVLVNTAGGFGGGTALCDTELELFVRLHHVNVMTAVSSTHALAPRIAAAGGGCIVNVAARAALDCPAGLSAYSASKAALIAITRTLAAELADSGVRVNALLPTTIDTPANREAMPDADFASWTPPARIADVIAWLASDAGAVVSGGLIPV